MIKVILCDLFRNKYRVKAQKLVDNTLKQLYCALDKEYQREMWIIDPCSRFLAVQRTVELHHKIDLVNEAGMVFDTISAPSAKHLALLKQTLFELTKPQDEKLYML